MTGKIICRVLTGPTASGKSDLAMRLAIEENWDILCMDSMQIYKGMNIGTAKPSDEDRSRVRHYLLDLCDPKEEFNVSQYVETAEKTVRELHKKGRKVLFVGGTGLYLEAMMNPLNLGAVPADKLLRDSLQYIASLPDGKTMIDRMLREVDPLTADKLPLNDIRRRIRAIEVSRATGIPFSNQKTRYTESPFEWIAVSTEMPRNKLYARINERVQQMLKAGLADEVRNLLARGVSEDAQSMQAIGYKEMIPFLRGDCSLEKAAEDIRTGTRHYAKRQITFLKRMKNIQYVQSDTDDAFDTIRKIMRIEEETDHEQFMH